MLGLGQRIFPLLALALEMEESFFDDKVSIASAQPSLRLHSSSPADTVPRRHPEIATLPALEGRKGQRKAARDWCKLRRELDACKVKLMSDLSCGLRYRNIPTGNVSPFFDRILWLDCKSRK